MPHVEGPPAGLADQGVGLDEQLRERLAAFRPIAERQAALAKLLVVELEQLRLHGGDLGHKLRPIRQPPAVRAAGKRRKRRSEKVENAAHEDRQFFRVFVMVWILCAHGYYKTSMGIRLWSAAIYHRFFSRSKTASKKTPQRAAAAKAGMNPRTPNMPHGAPCLLLFRQIVHFGGGRCCRPTAVCTRGNADDTGAGVQTRGAWHSGLRGGLRRGRYGRSVKAHRDGRYTVGGDPVAARTGTGSDPLRLS